MCGDSGEKMPASLFYSCVSSVLLVKLNNALWKMLLEKLYVVKRRTFSQEAGLLSYTKMVPTCQTMVIKHNPKKVRTELWMSDILGFAPAVKTHLKSAYKLFILL